MVDCLSKLYDCPVTVVAWVNYMKGNEETLEVVGPLSDNFLNARLLKSVACSNWARDEWARWSSCYLSFGCHPLNAIDLGSRSINHTYLDLK